MKFAMQLLAATAFLSALVHAEIADTVDVESQPHRSGHHHRHHRHQAAQGRATSNQALVAVAASNTTKPFQCVCQRGAPPPPPPCSPCSPAVLTDGVADQAAGSDATPPAPKGPYLDVDTEMPYGNLEPFGREDTAQELTESSMKESDAMVDQLEKAEVAEEKRAVFRALTRLRGAAIASFDGIAHSQTGNIDEYAKTNKWRDAHPVHHLASEEADVYKWAFPDKSE
eukprot:CAMPEP_0178420492 /NCGR_PEP_ID=MMETSP0689_2-20121128/26158_1 /TAXON_ID=160604 /ORGANISM="Amphidinium massartii, Strain CS-259" /LENGTH=226 /DNA_ID=CAMNT_0020041971 /DNA_START=40 /DNA_END=720 /DNA_ORIENTATION=-